MFSSHTSSSFSKASPARATAPSSPPVLTRTLTLSSVCPGDSTTCTSPASPSKL